MGQKFKESDEGNEYVSKFEEMLKNNEVYYFKSDIYEYIIEYYLEKQKLKKALKAVDCAILQYPYSSDFKLYKAHILVNIGLYEEATQLIDYLETFNQDEELLILRGIILNHKGQYEEAISYFSKIEPLVDDKESLYLNLAHSYQSLTKYDEAIEYYKKVIEINIENEDALYELAFCLDITNQLESSISFYEKFIDQDPFCHIAWYNLGLAYSKLNYFDKALMAYDYATVIKEDFSSAYFNMGTIYASQEKHEDAIRCFEKVLEYEDPTAETLCCIASCYQKLDKLDVALNYYRKASKLEPRYADAWYGIGSTLISQKKAYEALYFINKAIELDDSVGEYYLAKADAEYLIGNFISAEENYDKASTLIPHDPDLWLNWSLIYFESGNYDKACDTLFAGIEALPEEADLYYRAVVYLIYAGLYKEALLYLENALILDFDKHVSLYEFFSEPNSYKTIFSIIEQFRKS